MSSRTTFHHLHFVDHRGHVRRLLRSAAIPLRQPDLVTGTMRSNQLAVQKT